MPPMLGPLPFLGKMELDSPPGLTAQSLWQARARTQLCSPPHVGPSQPPRRGGTHVGRGAVLGGVSCSPEDDLSP